MEFFRDIAFELLGPDCAGKITTGDLFDIGCLKLLLSKILGYGMVFGASVIKLPQIIKILRSRSVQGLNFMLTLLEMLAYTITLSYNSLRGNAFSTYGETLFLLVQNLVIISCLFYFPKNPSKPRAMVTAIGYSLFVFLIVTGLIDVNILWYLQALTVPMFAVSRIPQIIQNVKSQSTGQLSMITWFLQFGGNMARIFTTVQEVGDIIILLGFLSTGFLNGVIFAQIVYYSYLKADVKSY